MILAYSGFCPDCEIETGVPYLEHNGSLAELEEKIDNMGSLPLIPIPCQKCTLELTPKHFLVLDNDHTILYRIAIGDEGMPVVGDQGNYINSFSEEEQQEIERGLEKYEDTFRAQSEDFWFKYTSAALENWKEALAELTLREYEFAYQGLNITISGKTVAAYRKDALQRFKEEELKRRFWRLANDSFVYEHLLFIPPMSWKVSVDLKRYGRFRMTHCVLNFPFPEELEILRTQHLGHVLKKSKDSDFMKLRFEQLHNELKKANNKVRKLVYEKETLEAQLRASKQQTKELQDQLERTLRPIITRSPSDVQKISDLKGLVRDLIEENRRLEGLVPQETNATLHHEPEETVVLADEQVEEIDFDDLLATYKVAIFGDSAKKLDHPNYRCHFGDYDQEVESLVIWSDICVVLTQSVSHTTMYAVREAVIEHEKLIIFSRHSSLKMIAHLINRNISSIM